MHRKIDYLMTWITPKGTYCLLDGANKEEITKIAQTIQDITGIQPKILAKKKED